MKTQRVIHRMWREWEKIPKEIKEEMPLKECFMGKYQYIYTEGKNRISLIQLNGVLGWGKRGWQNHEWEICGGGLQDIQRFATKKEAVLHIKKLLKENPK